jgi:hypothetical protein
VHVARRRVAPLSTRPEVAAAMRDAMRALWAGTTS